MIVKKKVMQKHSLFFISGGLKFFHAFLNFCYRLPSYNNKNHKSPPQEDHEYPVAFNLVLFMIK